MANETIIRENSKFNSNLLFWFPFQVIGVDYPEWRNRSNDDLYVYDITGQRQIRLPDDSNYRNIINVNKGVLGFFDDRIHATRVAQGATNAPSIVNLDKDYIGTGKKVDETKNGDYIFPQSEEYPDQTFTFYIHYRVNDLGTITSNTTIQPSRFYNDNDELCSTESNDVVTARHQTGHINFNWDGIYLNSPFLYSHLDGNSNWVYGVKTAQTYKLIESEDPSKMYWYLSHEKAWMDIKNWITIDKEKVTFIASADNNHISISSLGFDSSLLISYPNNNYYYEGINFLNNCNRIDLGFGSPKDLLIFEVAAWKGNNFLYDYMNPAITDIFYQEELKNITRRIILTDDDLKKIVAYMYM